MKRFITLFAVALIAISCRRDRSIVAQTPFSNVLILGNSITYAPADPSIGWNGSWGMAATAPDSDYVHLITVKFKQKNDSCKVAATNIASFETGFATFNLDSALLSYKKTNPDLVIIRIGENVQTGFDAALFDTKYAALVNYFKAANPKVQIFAVGSFWAGKDAVNAIMGKYSTFLSLSYLSIDPTNESSGTFANPGVAVHPSDKGMKAITNAIWTSVQNLNN